jgi:hypothetical protein
MDASNLATLFTPNLLHNFSEESSAPSSSSFTTTNSEKLEFVSVMKTLIEKRDTIFEVPTSGAKERPLPVSGGCQIFLVQDVPKRGKCTK